MLKNPVNIKQVLKLTDLNIKEEQIKSGIMTINSDKQICFKEERDNQPLVRWVEVEQGQLKEMSLKSQAQSVMLHPDEFILTVKANTENQQGHFVQVFNIDRKKKLNSYTFKTEKIDYWCWIDSGEIAIVTSNSIQHWAVDPATENQTNEPRKVFERAEDLKTKCQVLGQVTDEERQTCILQVLKQTDKGIAGKIQFQLAAKDKFQVIDGCGADLKKVDGKNLMIISRFANDQHTLNVKDLTTNALNHNLVLNLNQGDFVCYILISKKLELVQVVTFNSVLLLFDIITGTKLYQAQLTTSKIFEKVASRDGESVIFMDRKGAVFNVNINKETIVDQLKSANIPAADSIIGRLAERTPLEGCKDIVINKFNSFMAQNMWTEASEVAAASPDLRSKETLNRFLAVGNVPNQKNPVLFYFKAIMAKNPLNDQESVILAKLILQQDRDKGSALLTNYLTENKITCSDELGTIVSQNSNNQQLAQQIYKKSGNVGKIVETLVIEQNWPRLIEVAKSANDSKIEWENILIMAINSNPQESLKLARVLAGKEQEPRKPSKVNIQNIAQFQVSKNLVTECTAFLISALKEDKAEDAHMQTKLFELNLNIDIKQAEQIFQLNLFNNFDRNYIAKLCEQKLLFHRALQYQTNLPDIRRVILNTQMIPEDFIIQQLSKLSVGDKLTVMKDLAIHNPQMNNQIVARAAVTYFEEIGAFELIKLFESASNFQGLQMFLAKIANDTKESQVIQKQIECCLKVGNKDEVVRVIQTNEVQDPVQLRDFLIESKLQDPIPIMSICNRHGYIEELISYLLNNEKFRKQIDTFIFQVNPKAAPKVLKILLDENQDEKQVKGLLDRIGVNCSITEMIEIFEKDNRLQLTSDWLEARIREGNQMVEVHNAFIKIQIDNGKTPENLLNQNNLYDTRVIGRQCEEKHDYELAFISQKKGENDDEILALSGKNSMFKQLANYLTKRKDKQAWTKALSDTIIRTQLVEQINSVLLNEQIEDEEITVTITSFMDNEIFVELSDLLEKLIFYNKRQTNNGEMQELLISNAFHTNNSEKAKEQITRLDDQNAVSLAQQALSQQSLYEHAFMLFKKAGNENNQDAIDVLLTHLDDHVRAVEFVNRVKDARCYSRLAKYELQKGMIKEAVYNFLEAKDDSEYHQVVAACEKSKCYLELVEYLRMVRENDRVRDRKIDNMLLFSLAKLNKTLDFDTFINDNINVDWKVIGEKCVDHKLQDYARKIFTKSGNNHKLTMCLVHLGEFTQAMDQARKANSVGIWFELFQACIRFKDQTKASIAGLNVIATQEWVEKVRTEQEKQNLTKELIILFESGLAAEKVNNTLLTELGILQCQQDHTKLMNHCRTYIAQLNTAKLIRQAELHQCWVEVVFLYSSTNQYDQAINVIIEHSPEAFTHEQFLNIITRVTNQKLLFKGILFYLEEEPGLLNNLLQVVGAKLDSTKLVQIMQKTNNIEIIADFLKTLQHENVAIVNDEINKFYLEEEDQRGLLNSITSQSNYSQDLLLKNIEKSDLPKMHSIAVAIYRKNKKYDKALEVCKQNSLWIEAIETVRDSQNAELIAELLVQFLEDGLFEYQAAGLYGCQEAVTPDMVMEWNWIQPESNLFSMPQSIQITKDLQMRVTGVEKKTISREVREKKEKEEQENDTQHMYHNQVSMLQLGYGTAPSNKNTGGGMGNHQGQGGFNFYN